MNAVYKQTESCIICIALGGRFSRFIVFLQQNKIWNYGIESKCIYQHL